MHAAIEHILRLGTGTQLVKLDMKDAYCIVPLHPQDHHLLEISWERTLPFGLRSALKIFSVVTDMIAWALQCAGVQHQLHYLDDFLFMGAPAWYEGSSQTSVHCS